MQQLAPLSNRTISEEDAWAAIRLLAGECRAGLGASRGLCFTESGAAFTRGSDADLVVYCGAAVSWRAAAPIADAAAELLDVCVPLCVGPGAEDLVVAHLGQSIDGRVATPEGESPEITGLEDVRFTHRMRALFDAVLVGATTAVVDDPRLTTRLVPGNQPVRVVLDPRGRVPHARQLFRDGQARTLVVTGAEYATHHANVGELVEVVPIPLKDGELPLDVVRAELGRRGLRRLFIEGGGVTVSRFLSAGLVDRLEVAIAPRIIGVGEAAITLVESAHLLRDASCRRFFLGEDVLFDFDLRAARTPRGAP